MVDAGITPDVSAQIQELAGQLTGRPVRYLANTTYHGDHTFGNMEFPAEVVIISSRVNKDNMTDLGYEVNPHYGGDEPELPVPRQRQGRPPRVMPILDDDDDD